MLQLSVAAEASRKRKQPLPHTLFTGSAGCGKTTTANYIAELMGTSLINMSPVGAGDLKIFAKTLIEYAKKFKRFPIVFIDEIHHVTNKDQEMLGIVMERFEAPIRLGASDIPTQVKLPPFTLIGATTDAGRLLKPFRDRFKLNFVFKEYTKDEAIEIAKTHSERLGIEPTEYQYETIVECGRFTPRNIVSILERYRDFVAVFNAGEKYLDDEKFATMLNVMGIKHEGLTDIDILVLKTLAEQNTAVGIDTLSLLVNEGSNTLSRTVEPYLLQKGLIQRSPKGRLITDKGLEFLYKYKYIDKEPDFNVQQFDFLE